MRLLGNHFVFQAKVDGQRVGEHDHLRRRDSLPVVELAHHLDEVCWVARVLAHAIVDLRVCLRRVAAAVVDGCCDGDFGGCFALNR